MARSVPLRHSLLIRLLATSVLVALGSIVASAWLATQTATRAIQRDQGRALSKDIAIYDALLSYATNHRRWDDVGATVQKLADKSDRRIILTTPDRQLIVDSAGRPNPIAEVAPRQASTVIDSLHVVNDVTDGGSDQIDPRVLGPYRLSAKEKATFPKRLSDVTNCLNQYGEPPAVTRLPNGRPVVKIAAHLDPSQTQEFRIVLRDCSRAIAPTEAETRALSRLNQAITTCLKEQGITPVQVGADFTPVNSARNSPKVQRCIDSSRRAQLAGYVAPAVLLFAGPPDLASGSRFELSRANTARIAGVTALVLVLTVLVTVAVGTRLVRPLRALADAVHHPNDQQLLGSVTRTDEIGYLTNAFHDLSQRRQQAEAQRKAMVSDIAHELRTPLNNIRGWLEAAEDGVATVDRSLTSSLLEEALLLQHVIDDLQDLAEAEAGELQLHVDTVAVTDLLEQVASAHRGRSEAAGVLLETQGDGDLQAAVDPVRMRQAIGNLVSNAIRHSPPGATVTLRARHTSGHLLIDVEDHGPGLAPDELPHVFDRFWRAEKSRSRQTGGSGLGLAIVRQLIQAHGGEVRVISNPGIDTVFTIDLPEVRVP